MRRTKKQLVVFGLILIFALTSGYWQTAKAHRESDSITRSLIREKPLDISIGKGGVYFPSSSYSGYVILTRVKPENTKELRFTQRWTDIHVFESSGKEINSVYGYVYIYFNLNSEDYVAWNKGKLSIYHYNESKKAWEACETQLLASKNAPYGRVRFLITDEFGRYGLAIKR